MPLKVSDGIGAWIDDFKKSDAPQFKGKSEKERREMGIAAYLSAKKGPKDEAVKSADKKPEVYTKPDGKRGVRMVATDKEVVTKEDSDAVKAFLAKGGKIKKLPPGKAAGYHGKDDPGKDVRGVMDKPDTDRFSTRKKVKSMESAEGHFMYKDGKKVMVKTKADHDKYAKMGYTMNEKHMKTDPKLKNLKVPNEKDPSPFQKYMKIRKNRQTNEVSADKLSSYIQKASDATKHRGMPTRKVDNRYSGVAKAQDKLAKSGMMGTTAQKVSRARVGASMKEDTNFEVNIDGLPMMFMSGSSPGEIKAKLRGIVKQPSMITGVKRVTDATVRKTFRLKAQGKDEEETNENYKYDYGSPQATKLAKKMTPGQNEAKDPNEYDKEGAMMKSQLRQICSANESLMKMVKDDDNLPEWVQSKVTKATDYMRSVRDYLQSEKDA